MFKSAALALLLLAAIPVTGQAQSKSKFKGLGLSLDLNSATQKPDDNSGGSITGSGAGGTITLGLSENLGLFMRVDAGAAENENDAEYIHAAADIGIMYLVGTENDAFRPYLSAAINATSLATVEEPVIQSMFTGRSFGGGVYFFLSRRMALHAGAIYSTGDHSETTIDGEKLELGDDQPGIKNTRFVAGLKFSF